MLSFGGMDHSLIGTEKIRFWILVIAGILVFYAGIGSLDIYALDEAKNAECAREMLETGNSIVPTFNYELRTDKPPLHYYFMMIGYKLFGVGALGARFFGALMGLGTVLLVYLFGKRFMDEKTGWMSAIILLVSLHFAIQMHMAVPDPYLIFFLTLGFFAFYGQCHEKKYQWTYWFLFYASIGLGLLCKGPIALGLTGIVALLYLVMSGQFTLGRIWSLQPFLGIALSLAIAFPWYYRVHIATQGAFTEGFFLDHNLNRFSDSKEGHGGSIFLPTLFVFMGFLGVLPFLFSSIRQAIQVKKPLLIYSLLVALTVTGFFSFSGTKLPNYTVPSYPFLAIVIGYFISHYRAPRWLFIVNIILVALLPVVAYFALKNDPDLSSVSMVSLYFIPLVAIYIFDGFRFKKMDHYPISSLGAWIVTVILFFTVIFPPIDDLNPVSKLGNLVSGDDKEVVAYKHFNPAFSFLLRKKITVYDDINDLRGLSENTIIISRKKYREEITSNYDIVIEAEAKDIFEIPTTWIFKLKKNPPSAQTE